MEKVNVWPHGGTAALRLFARRTGREQHSFARRRIPVADRQRQPHGGGERTAVDAGQRKPRGLPKARTG